MSQKYRHRGYRDNDWRDDRDRPERTERPQEVSPEQRAQIRSLRKATDREVNEVVRCPTCGRNVESSGSIGPDTVCPSCRAAVHCCRTCLHFDSSARWECRASIDVRVSDKGAANDCLKFEPRLVLDATGRRSQSRGPTDPKSAFENLFKR